MGDANAARHGQPHKVACHAAEPIRPPQAQLCTGGGLHDALVRGQWHTAPWGGGVQPHTHTPRHSTTHNNTASLTSAAPGVARRSPPAILATTHSAHDPLLDAHTWSPQGGGQGGEGAGPKVNRGHHRERGQPHTNMGTHNAPPHSRHFPHRTQPPHTATAHAVKH